MLTKWRSVNDYIYPKVMRESCMEECCLGTHDDLVNHELALAADDFQISVKSILVCAIGTLADVGT